MRRYLWKRSAAALTDEDKFVESQQLEAYFREANGQNITGALVWSLMVYYLQSNIPIWTWLPFLLLLYVVTILRALHIRQFFRRGNELDNDHWASVQILLVACAGVCWGVSGAVMLPYLVLTDSILLIALIGVSVSFSASEGASFSAPSVAFSLTAIVPIVVALIWDGESLHLIAGILLLILLLLSQSQGKTRNDIFMDSRRLMYRNEELVKELAKQKEVAERANEAKTRFLAAASHDMRQPLQSAGLSLHLLGLHPRSEIEQRMLAHVEESFACMQEMLDGVLDISRLEAGVEKVDQRAIALNSMWHKLEQIFSEQAAGQHLELRFRPTSLWVQSDAHHLLRILQNLICNALRYTDRGGVLVSARARGNRIWLEIRDTGCGIPVDRIQEIFQEFVQLNNPERDRNKGLGLGLAIVDRTIKLLGYELCVHSKLGSGTLFRIIMPKVECDVPAAPSAVQYGEVAKDISGMLVLVVEDNQQIRLAMQAVLESWGCLVTLASDARSACDAMRQALRTPEVMLLDYRLPDGNGTDLAMQLFEILDAKPPTFILTGDVTAPELTVMKNSGLRILHKPVNSSQLRAEIAAIRLGSTVLAN